MKYDIAELKPTKASLCVTLYSRLVIIALSIVHKTQDVLDSGGGLFRGFCFLKGLATIPKSNIWGERRLAGV